MPNGFKELAEAAYFGTLTKEMVDEYISAGGNIHAWIQCNVISTHNPDLKRDDASIPKLEIGNHIIIDQETALATSQKIEAEERALEKKGEDITLGKCITYFSLFGVSIVAHNNSIAIMLFDQYYDKDLSFPHAFIMDQIQNALEISIEGSYQVFSHVLTKYEEEDIDIRSLRDHYEDNLFHMAAECGNVQIGARLLEYGFPIDGDPDLSREGEYTDTPLCAATMSGYTNYVKFLLENGAQPNHGRGVCTTPPINYAVREGYLDIVKLLAQHGGTISSCILNVVLISTETADSSPKATFEYVYDALVTEGTSTYQMNQVSFDMGRVVLHGADLEMLKKLYEIASSGYSTDVVKCADVLLSARYHEADIIPNPFLPHLRVKHDTSLDYQEISEIREFLALHKATNCSSSRDEYVVIFNPKTNAVTLEDKEGKDLKPDDELLHIITHNAHHATTSSAVASGAGGDAGAGYSPLGTDEGLAAAFARLDIQELNCYILNDTVEVAGVLSDSDIG